MNVFSVGHGRHSRVIAGIGQKSGVYWALDAVTGELVWSRLVGHGDDPGGIQWGTAVDRQYIYAAIGHNRTAVPYALPSGEIITGGSFGRRPIHRALPIRNAPSISWAYPTWRR